LTNHIIKIPKRQLNMNEKLTIKKHLKMNEGVLYLLDCRCFWKGKTWFFEIVVECNKNSKKTNTWV